jgi:serine/threonine protein kinase
VRTCPECHHEYDDDLLHCPEDGHDLAQTEADELIGSTVGSYQVTKLLGRGGMGAVYAGLHPVIGSRVAIKFLHSQYSNDKKIVDRFFNEARAVNIIGHDNVLKILDLNVTAEGHHYFVMEFLQGRALQALVRPDLPLPLATTGPILLQICAALQAAHDKGIVHRDLKPDNVYLINLNGRKNFVKVVDFGIAKLTDGSGASTGKTQTGMVMGTPAYMSPEQGSGETSKIDARSDIYSLGVMMFQMATGRLPFPGQNFGEVLIGHLQKPPPQPRALVPEIPAGYEAVILKCLAKAQADRFASMNELHDAIFAVMQQQGLPAELPLVDTTDEFDPVRPERTPASQGPRTPSRPGTNPPRGVQGGSGTARASSVPPRGPQSRSGRTGSSEAVTQMHRAERSRLPLLAGALLLLLMLGGLALWQVRAAEQRAQEAERARLAAAEKARQKALEAQREAELPVFLSVVSDPMGAETSATWKDGAQSGTTPLSLEVPRGGRVHLEFKKDGFAPASLEVVADQPKTVSAPLRALPPPEKVAEAKAPGPAPRRPRGPAKGDKKQESAEQKDGLIDLGDAFK